MQYERLFRARNTVISQERLHQRCQVGMKRSCIARTSAPWTDAERCSNRDGLTHSCAEGAAPSFSSAWACQRSTAICAFSQTRAWS